MNRYLLGIICILTSVASHAFVLKINSRGQVMKWDLVSPDSPTDTNVVNRSTRSVRYFIGSEGYSAANRVAELNAVRASFAQWQAVGGVTLKFEEAGTLPGAVDVNTLDNTNVVFWAKSTLVNGGNNNISGATAVTFFDFWEDHTLAEADIAMNGAQFAWFTDVNRTTAAEQFVEAVLCHEIGHMIGLDHSPVGGATLLARGAGGLSVQAGLSLDEVLAARALYPLPATLAATGKIHGRITMNGGGVLGAAVSVEDGNGNVVSGTVSQPNGQYESQALPPGVYRVRVSPFDPAGAASFLLRGRDIGTDYVSAETAFQPTSGTAVTVTAGGDATLNLTVTAGNPPFRITRLRPPTLTPNSFVVVNSPVAMSQGQSNYVVGVYSPDLPTSGATLAVTGTGVTTGAATYHPNIFSGLNLISVPISVSADAPPGLRTLVVQMGNNFAYANGFLEILPPFMDFNFDGLDDLFQRRYFPVFTSADAAPDNDFDGDKFSNRFEWIAGTDPTNRLSAQFKILSVRQTLGTTTVTFQSEPGKRFQLHGRQGFPGSSWQPVGSSIVASGNSTEVADPAGSVSRFYRVEYLP